MHRMTDTRQANIKVLKALQPLRRALLPVFDAPVSEPELDRAVTDVGGLVDGLVIASSSEIPESGFIDYYTKLNGMLL